MCHGHRDISRVNPSPACPSSALLETSYLAWTLVPVGWGGPNGEAGRVNAVPSSVGVADNSPRKQEGQEVYCLPPPCGKQGNQSPERLNESPETVQ